MYKPKKILFEKAALDLRVGKRVMEWAEKNSVPYEVFSNNVQFRVKKEMTSHERFIDAKRTLAVTIKKSLKFQTCKPSADYQLPLVTGCPGMCEYCYLFTNLGINPYIRIYANIEEILSEADSYIEKKSGITTFEGAATSDPLPVEPIAGLLTQTIEHIGKKENGRFRFVTKFTDVEPLLYLKHNKKTSIRFSVNAETVLTKYEIGTPRLDSRLEAAAKIAEAGYPLGFIVAPIFVFEKWQEEYSLLFEKIKENLPHQQNLSFEFITHRFTARAKNAILQVYPETTLPLDEKSRRFKFGQFGYGKYLYHQEDFNNLKTFFFDLVKTHFPSAEILYFV